ncbi:MAG: helix-turn-helix transcriptional regulator [Lentisphaeria bacterium]|nr:helix-turn-helix transcriptional regulator [Lentisphaeria bacterium]
MVESRIGKRIRQYRKEKSLTIRQFADVAGISTALVSQLERGIGNPSLSVLKLICRTLGIPLSALFIEEIDNASLIRRKAEHERIHNPNEKNAVYFNLTPGPLKSNVELLMMVLGPKRETNHGFSQHFEEEIAFLLEGEAYLVFEEEEFLLQPGDAVRILPSRKHKLRNMSDRRVRVLFIKSKSNY